ncbi:hypothetical protein OC861_002079 [Tilletia horrida]|nr:hypothetical protein OC861_002079 [Tilletia horrida]
MVRLALFISTLALASSFTAGDLVRRVEKSAPAASAEPDCQDYLLISARGTDEKQGPSFVFIDAIKETLSTVPNGAEVDVVYPATWDMQYQIGSNWIKDFLSKRVEKCPDEEYALLGYSQGAMVASGAIDSYKPDDAVGQKIKAVVMFGNPMHVSGRPGNAVDKDLRLVSDASGVATSDDAAVRKYSSEGIVLDVCLQDDYVCNKGHSKDPMAHGSYGADKGVQDLASRFLISKLSK